MCQLICPHLTFLLRIKIFKLITNNKWGNIHSIPIYSRWFDKITWNNLDILLIKRLKPSKGELAVTCVTDYSNPSLNKFKVTLSRSFKSRPSLSLSVWRYLKFFIFLRTFFCAEGKPLLASNLRAITYFIFLFAFC